MFKKIFSDDFKIPVIMSIIFMMSFFAGSVYFSLSDAKACNEAKEYFSSFFENAKTLNPENITAGNLKNIIVSFSVLFISAFFRLGMVLNGGVLVKHGFVSGFTYAAFFKIFGLKGVFINLLMLPEALIFVPVLIAFSSTSTKMSFLSAKSKKNFLIFFVLFSMISATIFCGYAFFNGYCTTIFMKWVAQKV